MKVLKFTIPLPYDKSMVAEKVSRSIHYPHLHRHKEIQLTWIQKGQGTLIVAGCAHRYEKGDIYLIGSDVPHVFKSYPSEALENIEGEEEAYSVFFDFDGPMGNILKLPEMERSRKFIQEHPMGFKIPEINRYAIEEAMLTIHLVGGIEHLIAFLKLVELIAGIESKLEPLAGIDLAGSYADNLGIKIDEINEYIRGNFFKEIKLEDIAKIAAMTPEAFCRYFKRHTGHTFISYLTKFRISEVCKRLLSDKYENVNMAAYQCGFKSIPNFNRVFKRVMGSAPKMYMANYNHDSRI